MKIEKIENALNRGVEKVYPSKKALKQALLSGKKLKIYQGFDPSAPSLHLGNYVGLLKLKEFQDLGHKIIFLIGDFTGMIGDPTDKESARKKLTRKEVLTNAKKWRAQISRFLKLSGQNAAEIKYNSQWLDPLSFKELLEITSNFTIQQMIQRDFFQERLKKDRPIYLHEFLYPVAQALDSVMMDVDLEIGGNDQTFNMLMGRSLTKTLKNKEKMVLTMKLLVDGQGKKIGKTTGNAVFLDISPEDLFGKVMAFPDETIIPGLELLTFLPRKEIKRLSQKLPPLELKKKMAEEIVALNYGQGRAKKAKNEFAKVFKEREFPETIKEVFIEKKKIFLPDLLCKIGLASSKSEAKRLICGGGVRIDREKQTDWKKEVLPKEKMVVQIGKRKFRKLRLK